MSEQARAPDGSVPAGPALRPAVVFAISSRHYGLPLASVREVIRVPVLTGVPRSPADVLGVILAGGAVTTVFDLCKRLGLEPSVPTEQRRVLLVKQPGEVIGVVVDRVLGVWELDEAGSGSSSSGSEQAPVLLDPVALFST